MPEDTAPHPMIFADAQESRLVLDQIANKWTIMILTILCPASARFNAIKRQLGGITHKALTEALRRLERNGLVTRHVISASPIAVIYSITALGRSLEQPFAALDVWAVAHREEVARAQSKYDSERNSLPAVSKDAG